MPTTRETIATILNESPELRALGLPIDAVLQADTADSPLFRPFIVIRWLDEIAGMGAITRRPIDLWVYDEPGDYDRTTRLGAAALAVLEALPPTQTESGWITKVETKLSGLGRGSDLYDDGYKAVVIPYRAQVIASGL